jgi:hypothetical protein
MTDLWDALCAADEMLGFESVTQGDRVFRDLVLARIIEPTSEADSLVLAEAGVGTRRMPPSSDGCRSMPNRHCADQPVRRVGDLPQVGRQRVKRQEGRLVLVRPSAPTPATPARSHP